MTPWPHQLELADAAYAVLQQYGLAYLATEERTGKTLSALLVAEKASVTNILIVTKKRALPGWQETVAAAKLSKHYTVTNYHNVHKLTNTFDFIILDEAHNYLGTYPKPSKIWLELRKLTKAKPILYLSATPYAQGPVLLYGQFALSSWSPWVRYTSFYEWHKSYGVAKSMWVNSREIKLYSAVRDDEVLATCKHLFITKTRKALGFTHEPEDVIHWVELSESTKALYNTLVTDRCAVIQERELICDTVIKRRTSLHMLEGGVAKIGEHYLQLDNTEKIDYIKANFGDSESVVIMYNYIAEGIKLNEHFKKATILQATSYAEGIDLSHKDHLVVYSQDFSAARHTQRRARQANLNRTTPIKVHFLLTQGGVSEQVYTAVSVNKVNYVDSLFEATIL
jgi:hypothetical protein